MSVLLASGILIAQSCSGPFCAPDAQFERPAAGLFADSAAPVAALGANGSLLLAWEFRAQGESDIAFSRREDGARGAWLDAPQRLEDDEWGAARSLEPRLASDGRGRVWVLWQDNRNGVDDLRLCASTDDGRTWPVRDQRVGGGVPGKLRSMAALAADGSGRLYAAWEDTRAGSRDLWLVSSGDGGLTWNPELRVDSDEAGTGVSYHPQLLVWDDGTVLVAWWDERDGLADVYVRRSVDHGRSWVGPEERVDPGDAGAWNSRDVVLSRVGDTVSLAWEEDLIPLEGNVVSRTSTDRGATWGAMRASGLGENPVIVAREGASPLVGWTEPPARGTGQKTSIGGRIVEIPLPTQYRVGAPDAVRPASLRGLERLASRWAGRAGDRAFFARGGAAVGRGLVDVYWVDLGTAGGQPQSAAILQFGSHLLATDVDVRARSLTGVATDDGTLHLVWVTSYGDSDDLGYARLHP